jgi:hypothetical protein
LRPEIETKIKQGFFEIKKKFDQDAFNDEILGERRNEKGESENV